MPSTYTNLLFHNVFSTKHRQPLVTAELKQALYHYLGGILRGEGATLIEINGMPDHLHLLIKCKPTHSLSDLLRKLKGNSAKWMNEEKVPQGNFHWQTGFAAFSVSESQAPAVREYIRQQETHHQKLSFQEELLALLQKHGIEYDEQYLWD